MPTQKLTTEIINAAIDGFESQKQRIDSQIAELRQLLGAESVEAVVTSSPATRKRGMSAAGRRRIAAAQKARWAKAKAEAGLSAPATPTAPKAKRKLSEAGRKAISEATKRRWALKRAEAQTQPASPKKATAKKAGVKVARKTGSRAPQKRAKKTQGASEATAAQ